MIQHVFRAVDPELRVVAVVDPNEAAARSRLQECDKEAVFYPDVETMLAKARLDAVACGTRCNLHAPYAIKLAASPLPLFLEKPVAINMKQAQALEEAAAKARNEVVVSFPLRVSPLCVLARSLIEDGAVGSPEHVLGINYVPYGTCYFDSQYREFEITQGLFVQKATHDFDYLMFLMGANITRVAATWCRGRVFGGNKPAGLTCDHCRETATCPESGENRWRNGTGGRGSHPCVFGSDIGSPEDGMNEDSSSALMEFASGAHGVYTQVFYTRRDAGARGATVSGYQGTVSFDWYTNQLRRVRHHVPFSDTAKTDGSLSHFGGDLELGRNFIDVIRGKAKSHTPLTMGLQSVYTCLAAKESAAKEKFVKVRQVGAAG